MSLEASIGPHLPYLRRFARALTGNQASGDAYALAALEALAAPPAGSMGVREQLYQTFLRIWGSVPLNRQRDDVEGSSRMTAADRALEAMTPLPRVVFLLRAMEGFTSLEIAEIIGRDQHDIATLLETAGRQIAAQLRTSVLIIEDEPLIAMDLEGIVTDLGHEVTQVARTHKEAALAMTKARPGLVLADIQLADGSSGLEAVKDILAEHDLPVVFITGHPEQLLTGARPEPTFLIAKPFNPENVKAVISQALFFHSRAALVEQVAQA